MLMAGPYRRTVGDEIAPKNWNVSRLSAQAGVAETQHFA
jgi:hypothetical protein